MQYGLIAGRFLQIMLPTPSVRKPRPNGHSDGASYVMALPHWIIAALALASTAVALYILWNLGVG